jgi:hypothetical protein
MIGSNCGIFNYAGDHVGTIEKLFISASVVEFIVGNIINIIFTSAIEVASSNNIKIIHTYSFINKQTYSLFRYNKDILNWTLYQH